MHTKLNITEIIKKLKEEEAERANLQFKFQSGKFTFELYDRIILKLQLQNIKIKLALCKFDIAITLYPFDKKPYLIHDQSKSTVLTDHLMIVNTVTNILRN